MNGLDEILLKGGALEQHGSHFTQNMWLMWLIIVGNIIIAIAYFSIPVALAYFVKKRKDLAFNWIFMLFSAFILLCGIHHVVHVLIFWYSVYFLQAVIDMLTGIISLATAIALWWVIPQALKIPNMNTLKMNLDKRKKAERELKELNEELETKVKERSEELQKNTLLLHKLVEGTTDSIVMKDKQGRYILANPIAQKLVGNRSLNEIIGSDDSAFFPPEIAKALMDVDKKIMKTGEEKVLEETIPVDGQMRVFLSTKSALKNNKGKIIGLVVIARDITERKLIEERKDEFISIASHELKTPLTTIKGYVQVLGRVLKNSEDIKVIEYIGKTISYINRLEDLVEDLLDVSRIQAGKLQLQKAEFKLSDLLRDAVESIRPLLDNHHIHIQGNKNHLIFGDRMRIEQVITNLLSNAIKYSPGGKSVEVDIQKTDHHIRIAIKDFGIGIPKESQEKIFNRFYRVDDSGHEFSGLGIGLYISHEIIQRHDGKIGVESTPRKGSTFIVELPVKK